MTRGQGEHGAACGGCRELALLEENESLRAQLADAQANARTAWDVHREHVDRTGALIAKVQGDLFFTRHRVRGLMNEPGVQHLLPPNWKARVLSELGGDP